METLSGIKACVFDAYGTLFDVHAAAANCKPLLGEKSDQLSSLWRQKQLEYTWLRSLMGEYADFWDITRDALDYAMAGVKLADPDIRARLLDLYWELDAYPEVPEMLTELKSNDLKTAILSNGSPDMLTAAVNSAGLPSLLDQVHSVADIGIFKPAPIVYQMSVDRLGVSADEICFMSSNAWDAAGAAHFGFQVVWVNRFNQPPERLPGKPKAVLPDLTKLSELLREARR
ncbi:haloacid dehalogenase type II [Aestuariispira insulae]|uniref:(S)-2-haloacid dehalogenase n=1 Tax=Aestuariispira insulae TaxID=1461337 RepID=A0A3D9HVH2_9PROT|nr:haloacid dehalogenase type II [Aestuariispira insulae]RED53457.1 2-haloacid dehalogenase [Aestuariispira insulae]